MIKKINVIYKDLVFRVARKQEFDKKTEFFRNCCFSSQYFLMEIMWQKLIVGNALCEKIIAIGCYSFCCFMPTGELVKIRLFLFLNKFYHGFLT